MKWNWSLSRKKVLAGYLFILPWIVGCLIFFLMPMIRTVFMSFQDISSSPLGIISHPVGWKNYHEAFVTDLNFVPKLISVLSYALTNMPLILIFSLFIAVLLNQKLPGRGFFRALYFLPVIIASGTVIDKLDNAGALIGVMGNNDLTTLLSQYAGAFVAELVNKFLVNTTNVIWDSGVQILIFLAGLQSISSSLYEAAKVDGASAWERFWKVTFPMISPLIFLNMIYTLINNLTAGYNDVIKLIRDVSFTNQIRLGYGASLSIVYFLITFAILLIAGVLINRFIFYVEE